MSPRIASDVRFLLVRQHFGVEHLRTPAIAADDAQEAVGVDLVLELAQEPVERQHQPVRPIGAQVARIEHGGRGLHRGVHEVGGELVLPQQAVERGVPRHPRLDDRGLRPQQHISGRAMRRLRLRRGTRRCRSCQYGDPEDSAAHEVSAV